MTDIAKHIIRDYRDLIARAFRETNEYREVRIKSSVIQLVCFDDSEIEIQFTARVTKE
jgi:hypothetical protein